MIEFAKAMVINGGLLLWLVSAIFSLFWMCAVVDDLICRSYYMAWRDVLRDVVIFVVSCLIFLSFITYLFEPLKAAGC